MTHNRYEELLRKYSALRRQAIREEAERFTGLSMADPEFRAKIRSNADQWAAIIAILSSFLLDEDEICGLPAADWGPEEQAFMARLNIRLLELEASQAAELAALDEPDERGEQ